MLTELGKYAYTFYLEDTIEQIIRKVSKLFAGDEKSNTDYKILLRILQKLRQCIRILCRFLETDWDV
jgi:hypothetical protein